MWCAQCQTQVPGIASPHEPGSIICAKCQTQLSFGTNSPQNDLATPPVPVLPGMRLDSCRMQATLARVDRLVQRLGDMPESPSASIYEVDPRSPNQWRCEELPAIHPRDRFPWLAALALAGGVMLLVCGCFLIGWGVVALRPELFQIGFPISVISLACMALAACLFFQDASGRQTETQKWLADVQNQLGGLRQITKDSRHSLGAIPELPSSALPTTAQRLTQTDERLDVLKHRIKQTRTT